MTSASTPPSARVLVIEDEMTIVVMIEESLQRLGAKIIGPASLVDAGLRLARETQIDAAVLDIHIRGGDSYPVADVLAERGIPFVFCSGYGDWAIEERHRHRPRLMKPFTAGDLEAQVLELLGARPG